MEENILVYTSKDNTIVTDSRKVAEVFGKQHQHVLRDIRNLGCSAQFHKSNFGLCLETKQLQVGSTQTKYYTMTKDGFTFLVMGYTGTKAAQFKEAYISAFNRMEQQLHSGQNMDLSSITRKDLARMLLEAETRAEKLSEELERKENMIEGLRKHIYDGQDQEARIDRLEKIILHVAECSPVGAPIKTNLPKNRLCRMGKSPIFYKPSELRNMGIHTFTMKVFRNRLNKEFQMPFNSKYLFAWLTDRGYFETNDIYIHRPSYECYVNGWIFACGHGSPRANGKKHTVPHFTEKGFQYFASLLKKEYNETRHKEAEE